MEDGEAADEGGQSSTEIAADGLVAATVTDVTKPIEWRALLAARKTVSDPAIIAEIFLALMIVLTNGAVVFAIVRPGNKRTLRTPINLLILQLAIVDLLIGFVSQPMKFYLKIEGIDSPGVCAVYLSLSLALDKASVVGFLMISIERFIAVRFPFRKKTLFTVQNVALTWAVAWIACFIYGLIPTLLGLRENWNAAVECRFRDVISPEFRVWPIALTTIVEGVVVSSVYSYLFVVARRHMRSIASLHVPVIQSKSLAPLGSPVDDVMKTHTRHELNVAFRCLLLVLVHFLCQWPISGLMLLSWKGMAVSGHLTYSLLWLRRFNSALNPLCYAFAKKDLQQQLKKTLVCKTE